MISKNTIRESNYELLRVISMIMIVAFHTFRYIDVSHFNYWQTLAWHNVRWFGLLGVNCFLIISAWFMIGKPIKSYKLINLISQTIFYCVLLFLCHIIYEIACGTFHLRKDIIEIELDALLSPLWSERYWFITAYIFLYLMVPLFNRLIQALSPDHYRRLTQIVSILVFLYLTMPQTQDNTTVIGDFIWVSYLYLLTAYLKLYGDKNPLQQFAPILFPLTWLLFIQSKQLLTWHIDDIYLENILEHTTGNSMRYSFLMLFLAIELFYLFQRIHFKNRFVNAVASCMFGVYLFHENKVFHICELLTEELFEPFMNLISSLPLFMLFLVGIQLIAGILVELFRQHFVEKYLESRILQKLSPTFTQWDQFLNQ